MRDLTDITVSGLGAFVRPEGGGRGGYTAWSPTLDGKQFCGAGCGSGCTRAHFLRAVDGCRTLLDHLGPDWRGEVWENLGWHYKAVDKARGTWKVHPNMHPETREIRGYTVFLGGQSGAGGKWAAQGATPEEAAREVLSRLQADLGLYVDTLGSTPEFGQSPDCRLNLLATIPVRRTRPAGSPGAAQGWLDIPSGLEPPYSAPMVDETGRKVVFIEFTDAARTMARVYIPDAQKWTLAGIGSLRFDLDEAQGFSAALHWAMKIPTQDHPRGPWNRYTPGGVVEARILRHLHHQATPADRQALARALAEAFRGAHE